MLFSSIFYADVSKASLHGGASELPSPVDLKSNIALVSHTRALAAVAVLLGLQQIKLAHPHHVAPPPPTHKLRVPSETRAVRNEAAPSSGLDAATVRLAAAQKFNKIKCFCVKSL